MLEDAVKTVMEAWPDLTYSGFFAPVPPELPAARIERKAMDRRRMLEPVAIAEFGMCRDFIAEHLERGDRVNLDASSYALKHRAEKWGGSTGRLAYTSNGMLIAAMIDQGFTVGKISGPNCFFNIARSSVRSRKERSCHG